MRCGFRPSSLLVSWALGQIFQFHDCMLLVVFDLPRVCLVQDQSMSASHLTLLGMQRDCLHLVSSPSFLHCCLMLCVCIDSFLSRLPLSCLLHLFLVLFKFLAVVNADDLCIMTDGVTRISIPGPALSTVAIVGSLSVSEGVLELAGNYLAEVVNSVELQLGRGFEAISFGSSSRMVRDG